MHYERIDTKHTFQMRDHFHFLRSECRKNNSEVKRVVLSADSWHAALDMFYYEIRRDSRGMYVDIGCLNESYRDGIIKFMDFEIVYGSWLSADEIEIHCTRSFIFQPQIYVTKTQTNKHGQGRN